MTTTYGRTATPCVLACLLASAASADRKGHVWLRKHGTVLLAGATHDVSKSPFDMATYLAVGYNALWDAVPSERLFDLAEQHRVPWFCNGVKGRLDSSFVAGFIVFDEPHFRKASSLDGSERVFRPHLSGVPGPLGVGICVGLLGADFNYISSEGNRYGGDSAWHTDDWSASPAMSYPKIVISSTISRRP